MKKVSLNGEWRAFGLSPENERYDFSGTVPGCVHTDLIRSGKITDPFYRDNADGCQWIENWSWTYEREFQTEEFSDDTYVEFEGLDVYCDVYLNDILIGAGADMHIPYRFPVKGAIRKGVNTIKVIFYSPVALTLGKPKLEGAFTTERLYTRRMQCTYYWDWVNRFITFGIYRDASLVTPDKTEISDVYIYTRQIDSFGAQIELDVNFDCVGSDTWLNTRITGPDGKTVLSKKRRIVESHIYENYDITEPKLWYPNGYGDPDLYTASLYVTDGEDIISEKTVRFGIRTVRILQKTDEPGSEYYEMCLKLKKGGHVSGDNAVWDRNEDFSGFIVIVNDIPVMCKGANWVPCEPFPSAEKPEKITRILTLAKAAGMNMVRIWGGGIFEQDHFYEECSRLGLIVTQDFLMACGTYPDREPWFLDLQEKEAEAGALRLRNHACLVWWTGDNENAVYADENVEWYPGRKTIRERIEPVLKRLDPMRYFLPSSPYNGVPYASITKGTTHNTQFIGETFSYIRYNELSDYREFFKQYLSRFTAEEPAMGAPMVSSLRKFMTDEDIFGEDRSMWRYHTKNNPADTFKTFEIFDYLIAISEKLLGTFTNSYDRVFKMQYVQYEWIRITMELYRRNKWFSSGMIYWMLSDCWPASGWAIIDYYCIPKAAYYGFKRTAKPVIASVDKENGLYSVYICNDSLESRSGTGTLKLIRFGRDMKEWTFDYSIEANSSKSVFSLPEKEMEGIENGVLICDIDTGDRAFMYEKKPALAGIPKTEVRIVSKDENSITLKADGFVQAVSLDGSYIFEDDFFIMLPGEERTIHFEPVEGGEIALDWFGRYQD